MPSCSATSAASLALSAAITDESARIGGAITQLREHYPHV
jgi:hypothetical protein